MKSISRYSPTLLILVSTGCSPSHQAPPPVTPVSVGTASTASQRPSDPALAFALERFFTAGEAKADWFSTSFLAAVSIDDVQTGLSQVHAKLGAYQRVETEGGRFRATFEGGVVPGNARLDADGRFVDLFLRPPVAR